MAPLWLHSSDKNYKLGTIKPPISFNESSGHRGAMEAALENELMDSAFYYRSVYNFQMPGLPEDLILSPART